ncbi:spectrin binding, partial [Trichomonas vaginalis G3]
MNLNHEYIAAHLSDYIQNENFFDTFDIIEIKRIMKYSRLTADEYVTLLKQSSSTLNAKELYISTRKANVTIQNIEEVVSILNFVKKYMKFHIFDGIIDFINENDKHMRDSKEEIKQHQTEIKTLQNQIQNSAKETTVTRTNEDHNYSREFLTKISSLKETKDFYRVYQFFEELSSKGNREIISKACEEGLWKKTTDYGKNVLHVASEKGNLNLVKSLIECGCDKEAKSKYGYTPLIWASYYGYLEVVKYLISVGADKEAKENNGYTPLIWASYYGYLEVVKYLISVGADKEAKENNGYTPLIFASDNGHLEVVKYLISVGADKEAKSK